MAKSLFLSMYLRWQISLYAGTGPPNHVRTATRDGTSACAQAPPSMAAGRRLHDGPPATAPHRERRLHRLSAHQHASATRSSAGSTWINRLKGHRAWATRCGRLAARYEVTVLLAGLNK